MDSETIVADESDLMSVISETTVGSINSPVMFNLLSRFKEPVITDSLNRNAAASPSIPDQNFDVSNCNLEGDFYKEAVGNLPSEDDTENSQSLLSERNGSSDRPIRRTIDKDIPRGKLSALEFNHSPQLQTDYCPKEAMLSMNERAKYVDDDLTACSKRENIHDSAANYQCIDDMHKAVQETLSHILTSLERLTPDLDPPIPCVKTRVTPISPFTGFDSEIYPESMPAVTVGYMKNISTHESMENNCLDILDIENTHKVVQDDNTKSITYDDEDPIELLDEDLLSITASEKHVNMKNTLIGSSDVQYAGLDDETQAPVNGCKSPELNLPNNLTKTIRTCPPEPDEEQNGKKPPFSENCQQHSLTKTDMLRVKDTQVSSPQLSVVSDQSTEICRLDFRAETINIAYSQSNDIPLDSMSPRVTYGVDTDASNHCSNRSSIETERSNVQKASLQDIDKEIKLQDLIDTRPNPTTLTNAEIHASSELSNQTPKQSDGLNTDYTPENLSKSNQCSRISQSVSTDDHVTLKLKPVENITFSDHLLDKSDQQETPEKNTQLSQSTPCSKSMINLQNFDKSKSEVQENECSKQNTPEAALRRSIRESKHPIRFSSPEQNIMAKADKQGCPEGNKMAIPKPTYYKTRGKKQKIPISFAQTKTERKGKTQDMDFGDDFEVHQEKLNTYIQMEINYGQIQDDLTRNLPARESFKRCAFQFKTLQPQLMKLLSDAKEESLQISSKACKFVDKSIMKTRIKLLSIRQKKLKALFDRHCSVQSTLKLMKSKLGYEDTTNFTHVDLSQSTTPSMNSKHYIPNTQTSYQSTILTTERQTNKRTELVLNDETGLFEAVGQKPTITQGSNPEDMAQKVPVKAKSLSAVTSSNHDGPSQQTNAITVVSVPRSMDPALTVSGKKYVQTNSSETPNNRSQKIVFVPVGKSLVGLNQKISSAPLYFKETNEARRNSDKLITPKFVPPTKQIFAKVDNNGSTVVSATSHIESMTSISMNNVQNKPSLPIIVPKGDRSSGAPQGTSNQVTKSSHDDELLDIILKSLDTNANETNGSAPIDSSYTDPHKLNPLHQEDSDGFEFEDETVDVTREIEIGSNISETNFLATVPNQQSNVQQCSADLVQNLLVKPSALDINKPSEAVNLLPTKALATKSPFHSPCRSLMSFKSNFSTSSARYLWKTKEKALKITQAKTARDFQAAIGNATDTKKYKKFPSLKKMIDKGLLNPGKNKLCIIHKGQRLTATLLTSGAILDASGQGFSTATKWFSAVTGAQLTMKAKAYKMVCYENTPLMELKKQYDKLDFNKPSSQICSATDSREQSNKATSANVVTSSFLQTRDDAASVFTCPTTGTITNTCSIIGPSTFTATPQYKTAFQSSTNATTRPVRYQITLPRSSNPQYHHQLPNHVRYSIRTRCTTPVSIPTNFIRVTNNVAPMNRSVIGNQHILHPRKQLIATATLSAAQSKIDDDASINPQITRQSNINEEIRSMLMKSVTVLLVNDSELVFYPDITEDFWTKPFKDVNISKELWKEVDGW